MPIQCKLVPIHILNSLIPALEEDLQHGVVGPNYQLYKDTVHNLKTILRCEVFSEVI